MAKEAPSTSHHESPLSNSQEELPDSGLHIDQGNEAVLLDIGMGGDAEKAQHSRLKLAKDGHVSTTALLQNNNPDPDRPCSSPNHQTIPTIP